MKTALLPTLDNSNGNTQSLLVYRQGSWCPNPELLPQIGQVTKTYTTKQVQDLLNLPNPAPLYAAKKTGLPYLHPVADIESNCVAVAAIKRNTWIVSNPFNLNFC
ncbi:hypothetical protein H6G89_14575 [Oscillatoria sp. FACHB-1407]|uniref:hypothetical protein n=1 Tax=Oscillatoria sp. FACHB-1407 TaxID=2692847 RepID=UPI001687C7D6|nr:hypothetical protein [Oscillatoria sp. FACHB-1407]MBD2462270.1 hypothetical protein [Oscillatoria sp. FACHB-1407]